MSARAVTEHGLPIPLGMANVPAGAHRARFRTGLFLVRAPDHPGRRGRLRTKRALATKVLPTTIKAATTGAGPRH